MSYRSNQASEFNFVSTTNHCRIDSKKMYDKLPTSVVKTNEYQSQRIPFSIDYILSISKNDQHQDQHRKQGQNQEQKQEREKKKKTRTVFTRDQIMFFESIFEAKKYLTSDERHQVARLLHLSEAQVKIWFQNRRNKYRRAILDRLENRR